MQLESTATVSNMPVLTQTLFAGAPDPGKDSPIKPAKPEPPPKHK